MKYNYTKNVLTLIESSLAGRGDLNGTLREVRGRVSVNDCEALRRCDWSLRFEWAVHKALYGLGIERERTLSADLNYPQGWAVRWAYNIFGCAIYLFI